MAQKSVATAGIERMWQLGAQIGALKPEALDRLDADGTMDAYADMTGAPAPKWARLPARSMSAAARTPSPPCSAGVLRTRAARDERRVRHPPLDGPGRAFEQKIRPNRT
ncbi:MAG: hypothetical protein J0J01_05045 [Reyranella sp.]|uniref:portal protein n=1 Tax=Reyranella sp. TaxID=1929291 RepID=UPI001AC3EC16|nr:portal protein [Reyranella sp.]MBN9086251.1 hypothetical protein [Reyranella sp.]